MGHAEQSASRGYRIVEAVFVLIFLALGFALRIHALDEDPFWVDEAESSINALTILEHGYPTDTYLGLPLYENTMVWRWPESTEYEFRDVSYSDRHVAVYHGWLPLYSIAAAFKLYGVQPDTDDGTRSVKHDLAERKRRTRAARMPAVIFGSIFLMVVFAGAKTLYGRDAAWTALIIGSVYPWHMELSRQARYYSLQVLLTTVCCIMLWLLLTRCEWKHIYLSSVAFVLLFHTHLLSFCTAAAVGLLIAPYILFRHESGIRKIAVLGVIVASGTLPWLILTGFYRHHARIPAAWTLLRMPADLFLYPPLKTIYMWLGVLILSITAWLIGTRKGLPSTVYAPFLRLAPVQTFICVWMICGYILFLRFIPAASFGGRMFLVYWGPLFLLSSIVCAAFARIATPRHSLLTSLLIMLVLFFLTDHRLGFVHSSYGRSWEKDSLVLDYIGAQHLDNTTRLYASPNDHLIFTFYSGLPIQSMAPVRRTFLGSYRGDILYIDNPFDFASVPFTQTGVLQAALRSGQRLSPGDAARWALLLSTRRYRQDMFRILGSAGSTPLETLPAFAEELWRRPPSPISPMDAFLTRGFPVRTVQDWSTVFLYRFDDEAGHAGTLANYADRLRGSDALVLSGQTVIYRSRWHPPGTCSGVTFRLP